MSSRIYLDNNATTFLDPQVADLLADLIKQPLANASSIHSLGREAKTRLIKARETIANYLGAKSQEIIFTSCGTEALNMLIRGVCKNKKGLHIITSSVEHASVYSTLKDMEARGYDVTFLPPGEIGAVQPEQVEQALKPNTGLFVLMAANNETGVKTDIVSIGSIAEKKNIPFVVDAVAQLGKEQITIPKGVSAMAFSGHKIHGPTGIGFCYVRNNLKLPPLLFGGEQESGRRGGTENLLGIIALAKAIEVLESHLPEAAIRMAFLRDKLENQLQRYLPNVVVNGKGLRVSNTTNIAFIGTEGETLLSLLDLHGVAVSHGSACSSGAIEPSRILLNMGIPSSVARSSIRFSLCRYTTDEEIDKAIEIIVKVVSNLAR